MKVSKDKVVSMHYTLKNDAGDVIDSSEGKEPLDFLQGHGNDHDGPPTRSCLWALLPDCVRVPAQYPGHEPTPLYFHTFLLYLNGCLHQNTFLH